MDMIGHQAIGPYLDMRPTRRFSEQVEIEGVVALFEERLLAAVTALRHMMRDARQDQAREASHDDRISRLRKLSNLGVFAHVTVIA